MFSNLELRVMATLAYSNQFDYPLTSREISARLIAGEVIAQEGWVGYADRQVATHQVVENALQHLARLSVVVTNGEQWALFGLQHTFGVRVSRTRQTQQKAAAIDELIAATKNISWIQGIAITGSVAVQNATSVDDIDVLLICQPKRLWLVRLLLLLRAWRAGRRVIPHRQQGNGWCFNLWLESDNLAVPKAKRSLYEAFEVIQARFVYARSGVVREWLQQNNWIAQFIPSAYQKLATAYQKQRESEALSQPTQANFNPGVSVLLDWLNGMAYILQTGYRLVRYGEKPKPISAAFFHQGHTKRLIYCRWRQLVTQAISTSR